MRKISWVRLLGTVCAAAVISLLILPQAARAQWRAVVGAQSKNLGHQALAFLPNEL